MRPVAKILTIPSSFDLDGRAGLLLDAADVLAAGPISMPILDGLDVHHLDPRRVLVVLVARLVDGLEHLAQDVHPAFLGLGFSACVRMSCETPVILMSIWSAVMPCWLPATLKSMSPAWSSSPRMSERTA